MLVDEIIRLLTEDSARLTDALLRTKVLLHKLGKKELADWVNYELNGYPDQVGVPDYRVLQSNLLGMVANIACRYSSHPLPISHLPSEMQENVRHARIEQSIAILEKTETHGVLRREMRPEAYALLEQPLGNGFRVERAWCETPGHDVQGILTQVRSRLLDFLLELKDGIGDADDDNIRQKADEIDTAAIFRHTVIGGNATFILGNNNDLSVRNNIQKGNFNSLAGELRQIGISEGDIQGLREALTEDEATGTVAISGGKTGVWFLGALAKAGKGSLKIGTDILAQVITKALTTYIGA